MTDHFKHVREKVVHRRSHHHTQRSSKINSQYDDTHDSKLFESNKTSSVSVPSNTIRRIQPVAESYDDDTILRSMNSYAKTSVASKKEILSMNKSVARSMILASVDNSSTFTNNNLHRPVKQFNQPNKPSNELWKDILKILYSVLGILLLSVMILPSILVYIFALRYSQTKLPEMSTYTNNCAGVSSNSRWQISSNITLTMTIDTSECNFSDTPLYLVSMAGTANHFCLTGYDAVFLPTKQSFQIYVESTCGTWDSSTMMSFATENRWDVNWVGFNK